MGSGIRASAARRRISKDPTDHREPSGRGKAVEEVTISEVTANNRRQSFEVGVSDGRVFEVPYGIADVDERVVEVYPDDEIGGHGFTFRTASGREDTLLAEQVLYMAGDPEVRHRHLLYELTMAAQRRAERSRIGVRQLARMLGTSPARVMRLLDARETGKSVKAMMALLSVLGAGVDLVVTDLRQAPVAESGRRP